MFSENKMTWFNKKKKQKILFTDREDRDPEQGSWSEEEDANTNIKNLMPEEYYAFLDIFDHKKAYKLPPHHPH